MSVNISVANLKDCALSRDAHPRRRTTSSAWINIGNGKGSHCGFGDSPPRHTATYIHT